jgi:hypothetical protein
MDEGEVAQLHQLGVARREGRNLHRDTGQNGDGPLGGGGGGGEECGIPCRRRQGQQGGVRGNFLDKGKMGAMGLEQRTQASKIRHMESVESEEGEKRPLGLTIISMSRHRRLDWNQKCAERGA